MSDAVEICNQLLIASESLLANKDEISNFEKSSVLLIKLKALNRHFYSELDKSKNSVDQYKEKVDKRRLYLENLLYEVKYWSNEIAIVRDINFPQLSKLANEIEIDSSKYNKLGEYELATSTPASRTSLETLHEEYLNVIENEKLEREQLKQILIDKQNLQYKLLEKINRKRKLLEELPSKNASIKLITENILQTLQTAKEVDVE